VHCAPGQVFPPSFSRLVLQVHVFCPSHLSSQYPMWLTGRGQSATQFPKHFGDLTESDFFQPHWQRFWHPFDWQEPKSHLASQTSAHKREYHFYCAEGETIIFSSHKSALLRTLVSSFVILQILEVLLKIYTYKIIR